jgi:hypothetical protein
VQVDVNSLPAPPLACYDAASHVTATSHTELALQGVWQEVLGLSQPPSVEADFFTELGGSSLQVSRSVAAYVYCFRPHTAASLNIVEICMHLCLQALPIMAGQRLCGCYTSYPCSAVTVLESTFVFASDTHAL